MMETITKSVLEVTAILQMKFFMNGEWKVKKCYRGRSTRPVTKIQKSVEVRKHREKMTKEAKKAALEECFRERLGFSEFKDIVCDELNRPIKV